MKIRNIIHRSRTYSNHRDLTKKDSNSSSSSESSLSSAKNSPSKTTLSCVRNQLKPGPKTNGNLPKFSSVKTSQGSPRRCLNNNIITCKKENKFFSQESYSEDELFTRKEMLWGPPCIATSRRNSCCSNVLYALLSHLLYSLNIRNYFSASNNKNNDSKINGLSSNNFNERQQFHYFSLLMYLSAFIYVLYNVFSSSLLF